MKHYGSTSLYKMGSIISWFSVIALFTIIIKVIQVTGQKDIYRIEEIVHNDGYYIEDHEIPTADSYMLTVHRIPRKAMATHHYSYQKPVVLLMHGLFGSSHTFISLGPKYSLAYNLVDAGFDVWLGNARGTKLSRSNNNLDPDAPSDRKEFFDFSFEEIGLYDVSAIIDYILVITNKMTLHYVGFGAGGTAFLVLNSLRPSYNERFASAHLMASPGYQRFFKNRILSSLAKFSKIYYELWKSLGLVELFPPGSADAATSAIEIPRYCIGGAKYEDICEMMGINEIMSSRVLNTLKDSETAGTSVKQLAHFGQNIKSRKFRRWDFGLEENLEMYGTINPPEYELDLITVNVTMHYSNDDRLVNWKDVIKMANDMPNCAAIKVPLTDFQHFDFISSTKARYSVNDVIVQSLKKYKYTAQRDYFNHEKWYDAVKANPYSI